MIGEKLLGQLIAGLVAIAVLAGLFFWFKSSYNASVIAEHESKVQKTVKAEEIKDAGKTQALVEKVAANRTTAKANQSKIAVAAKADAVANPAAANCKLSPNGLRLVNDSIRSANGTDILHDPLPIPNAAGERKSGLSGGQVAGRGNASATGVQGATPVPGGLDKSGTEKPTLSMKLKQLWKS